MEFRNLCPGRTGMWVGAGGGGRRIRRNCLGGHKAKHKAAALRAVGLSLRK